MNPHFTNTNNPIDFPKTEKMMNERIRELAHEAGLPTYNPKGIPTKLEKFAELIVRECADLFEVEWGEEKLTGNDVGYVVKKHFGVK